MLALSLSSFHSPTPLPISNTRPSSLARGPLFRPQNKVTRLSPSSSGRAELDPSGKSEEAGPLTRGGSWRGSSELAVHKVTKQWVLSCQSQLPLRDPAFPIGRFRQGLHTLFLLPRSMLFPESSVVLGPKRVTTWNLFGWLSSSAIVDIESRLQRFRQWHIQAASPWAVRYISYLSNDD